MTVGEFWVWLYLGRSGASLKFRQLRSAVFDALGYFLLVHLVGVFYWWGGAPNFGGLVFAYVITLGFLVLKIHTVAGVLILNTCILIPKFYTNTATGHLGNVVGK